jgi:predicted MFS family arabinose efflux permease
MTTRLSLRGRLGPLEERPFRLLWIARSGSALGDTISAVALAFAVLKVSDSASALGLVLAAFTLSRVAFTLVGGVWADRLPRRAVMVVADVVRGTVQAVVAVLLLTGAAEIWHLAAGGALVGAASAFFGPASAGFLPDTVSPHRLQEANALVSTSESAAWVLGPVVSGVLVGAFGPGVAFAVDAATYAISTVALLRIDVPGHAAADERQPFLRELAEGWREVRARTWLLVGFASFAFSNLANSVFHVLAPVVFARELGGASEYGVALTIGAVGGLVGSAAALRFRPRHPLRWSFPIVGAMALPLLALVPPLPAVAIGLAAAVMFGSFTLSNALWDTVVAQQVPRRALSRVNAYDWMISLVFQPLGFALAGTLAATIGLDETLLAAAALSIAVNVGVLAVRSVRDVERVTAASPGPDPAHQQL